MASEFHKEDALRCLSVAKKAAKEGDTAKAEKFALKAKKLCDCPEVKSPLLCEMQCSLFYSGDGVS